MRQLTRAFCIVGSLLVSLTFDVATGQVVPSIVSTDIYNPLRFPLQLRGAIQALGDRLQKPGQERSVMNGTLVAATGAGPAVVTYELPNKLRIDQSGSAARSLGYDGIKDWASINQVAESDGEMVETFLEDSPEGLLYALTQTASLRVIATFARFDDGTASQYNGPSVDIFQSVATVQSNPSRPRRQKHYFFDSRTHLLIAVSYLLNRSGGSTTPVQITYSNWITVGGKLVPGTIARFENGKDVFTFTTSGAAFSPAANDGKFSAP